MLNLAQKIGLDDELIKRLGKLDISVIKSLAARCADENFHILKRYRYIVRLAVILELAVRIKEKYDAYGIEEKVYYDTMSDIRIWCDHCGNKGLKNYGWLKNHVSFELFRLGRLQFQLYECKNKTLLYNKLPFSYGEKLIYIHIPEGEKLEKEKCISSIEEADAFFKAFFPEYSYSWYFCESWLLYDKNRDFMDENSNIVNFMSLFEHCYSVKVDVQAIERIFGKRALSKRSYPENTALQKSAKKYIMQGNRLGIGVAVIRR